MKKVLKIAGKILLIIVLVAAFLLLYFTLDEYRPAAREAAVPGAYTEEETYAGGELTLLSFNTGYAALGADEDFFMDGGSGVRPLSRSVVEDNLAGITEILRAEAADIYLLQEVDKNSRRSYSINEAAYIEEALQMQSRFACNYKCAFVPYPLPPTGKVESGLLTLSAYRSDRDERIALPASASWPVSVFYLDRCLLASYLPIEGSDKYLVVCNFHLEAYDDGEAKAAQTAALLDFLQAEYEAGNYVIAGGDFNQSFEGALSAYPLQRENIWTPGLLSADLLPEGWSFAYDLSVPSCRLLDRPLDTSLADTQYYLIDGYIISPNIELLEVKTLDCGFVYSDHNPVRLKIRLQ